MGIGMVVVCGPNETMGLLSRFEQEGEHGAVVIGRVTSGDGEVIYI